MKKTKKKKKKKMGEKLASCNDVEEGGGRGGNLAGNVCALDGSGKRNDAFHATITLGDGIDNKNSGKSHSQIGKRTGRKKVGPKHFFLFLFGVKEIV